jgi:tRNA(adenine34) deaminase
MPFVNPDGVWMGQAIAQARQAEEHGDVPIGAVVLHNPTGKLIAAGHNRREVDIDPTAHAEILALRDAAEHQGTWHLEDCTLYVTLEPCVMCAGALVLARLGKVVFGADDPKAGAVGALWDIPRDPRLNHQVEVTRGVREKECGDLLRAFFQSRRNA